MSSQAKNVENHASDILAANTEWAQRMTQRFQQYFPDPKSAQAPKILWIGCSDSRVQGSDATTSLPGNVFVHRNIANQFHLHDDNALSVLAYALQALAVQHVVVVGHTHCGGAITAMKEAALPQEPAQPKRHHTLIDSLYHVLDMSHSHVNDIHDEDSKHPTDALTRWLTPLVDRVRTLALPKMEEAALNIVIEENVKMQVENLAKLESFVKKSAKAKPVWVHGWVYDFSSGFIKDLEVTTELGGPK
ncbi:carbonic anhydrase [Melanogaster broomeanus]|nr:carbonic anhydrase [Melanogaster broomeanus]